MSRLLVARRRQARRRPTAIEHAVEQVRVEATAQPVNLAAALRRYARDLRRPLTTLAISLG